jgi:hypothetical protein
VPRPAGLSSLWVMSLPDVSPIFGRGKSPFSPIIFRGFFGGEMSPPISIPIVSLSGGTHPAMDA